MKNVEIQVRIATDYVSNIANGGVDERYYAGDMTAWSFSMGMRTRDWYLPKLAVTKELWSTPLVVTVDTVTAQPGRVVLQARSKGVLFTGDDYSNEYVFIVEFNGENQIRHVREYFNLPRMTEILRPAMAKWEALHGVG